jgi:hypothetical protein
VDTWLLDCILIAFPAWFFAWYQWCLFLYTLEERKNWEIGGTVVLPILAAVIQEMNIQKIYENSYNK